MRGGEAKIIHNLLVRSNYVLSPDDIYNKPRSVKNFIYASLDLTLEEEEKTRKNKGKK